MTSPTPSLRHALRDLGKHAWLLLALQINKWGRIGAWTACHMIWGWRKGTQVWRGE